MKSGMKNVDISTGDSGPISSQKVKKLLKDYEEVASAEHPDDWERRPLSPTVLYQINGGTPHGRLPMAGGAMNKSAVQEAARLRNVKPSNSIAYRTVLRENQELRQSQGIVIHENEQLRRNQEIHRQLLLTLLEKNNIAAPPELLSDQVVDRNGNDHSSRVSPSHAAMTPQILDEVSPLQNENHVQNGNFDSGGSNDPTGHQEGNGDGAVA